MRDINFFQSMRKNKLFFKILMYFLSLLIPIVIIGYISQTNFERLSRDEASKKIISNLQSSSETINIYLDMIHSINSNLYVSDAIQRNLRPHGKLTDQQIVDIPSIVKTISLFQNSMNPFLDTIFMFIDNKKVYTSNGVVDFATYFDKFYQFEDYSIDFWVNKIAKIELYKHDSPVQIYDLFDNSVKEVIPSMMTQYINGAPATIVTTISTQEITSFLHNRSTFSPTYYLIVDLEGNTILQSKNLLEDDIQEVYRSIPHHNSYSSFTIHTSNGPALVANVNSGSYGWIYYSITPLSAL